MTYPAWATELKRDFSPRLKQALLTVARGSTLWPTTTTDSKASGAQGYSTESGRHSGTTLTDAAVRTPLWATPSAGLHNYDEDPRSFFLRRERLKEKGINGNGAGVPVGIQAQLWATTTTRDWKDGSCAGADVKENALLGRQVVSWTEGERMHHTNSLRSLKTEKGGRGIYSGGPVLSPRFAETLMGWPTGWTASDSPATVSFPSKPRARVPYPCKSLHLTFTLS